MVMVAKGGTDDRPELLDLFSCAGLGADGYVRAGYKVTCVDNDPKALEWATWDTIEADAMAVLRDWEWLNQFAVIHASPPCQLFSATRKLADAQGKGQGRAVDLLTPTLAALRAYEDAGGTAVWIVENVPRSPLKQMRHTMLCGSSFGLKVQRHRLFASNVDLGDGPACVHGEFDVDPVSGKPRPWGVYYAPGDNIPSGGRTCRDLEHAMECMGVRRKVPWKYLCEGLPPAYTQWLGLRVKEVMGW